MSSTPLKVVAKLGKQFLEYSNGKKFFYLADTWWYGLTGRWTDKDFQNAVDFRKTQGFTAIQLVVGVPPEIPFWSRQSHNQGGHPFLPDFSPNPEYFNVADRRIQYLIEQGIVPVLFGNWGYHIDQVGVEKMKQFWAEIIRRYKDLPVIYCLTGEVDLFPPIGYFQQGKMRQLIQKFSFLKKFLPAQSDSISKKQRLENWTHVAQFIKSQDSVTPLTVHPHSKQSASSLFKNPAWLDIDAIQSGHSSQANQFFVDQVKKKQLHSPFLDLEAPYEGIFDQFYGDVQRKQFQIRIDLGASGYAYGAHGLWNLSIDEDPFLTHWGTTEWRKALQHSGARSLHSTHH